MANRNKPRVHARDHEHGGADPSLIHYDDVGDEGDGTSGGIQFDTAPQAGGFLEVTTTTGSIILETTGGDDITLDASQSINLAADSGVNVIANGNGGVIIDVLGNGDLILKVHSPTTNLILQGLPTSSPGALGALWNDGGTLKIA